MNKPYRLGAHALIFDQNNNLLLIRHQSYRPDEWNFPGGGREEGESPEENAVREVGEELGLNPHDLQVLGVSSYPNIYDFPQDMIDEDRPITHLYQGQHKDHVYIRLINPDAKIQLDRTEVQQYKWVNLAELPGYLVFLNQYRNFQPVLEEYYLRYQK